MNKKARKVERTASDDETSVGGTGDASIAALSSLIPHPSFIPLVIVNPASAGGATGSAWPRTASDLRTHFGAFNCAFTERAGDAQVIARSEAAQGRRGR